MVYAQIKDGSVVNRIVLDDISLLPIFTENFDACLRIDNLVPQPDIGWGYDGQNFTVPPPDTGEDPA